MGPHGGADAIGNGENQPYYGKNFEQRCCETERCIMDSQLVHGDSTRRQDARRTLIVLLVLLARFHENGDLMGGHFLQIEILQRSHGCEL